MPDLILPGQVEQLHLVLAVGENRRRIQEIVPHRLADLHPAVGEVERDGQRVALDLVRLEHRPVGDNLLTILVLERVQGEALSGQRFVVVVNRALDIDLAGHSRVRDIACQQGSEPHFGGAIETRLAGKVTVLGAVELVKVNRQIRLVPDETPAANQMVQAVVIEQAAAPVRPALVPDRAANGIGHHRIQSPVEHPVGTSIVAHVARHRSADGRRLLTFLNHCITGGDLVFQ